MLVENRMLHFWSSIVHSNPSKLSHRMYNLMKVLYDKGIYESPWMIKIKDILDKSGMSNLWLSGTYVNRTWLKQSMKLRLSDIYMQNWNSEMNENGLCTNYKIIKTSLSISQYLLCLDPAHRIQLCKFRCGNHRLPIMTGRYQNVAINDRICTLCPGNYIGDEFHYLFECTAFSVRRKQFLKSYYRCRPNTLKMVQLFNSSNQLDLLNLSKFCNYIMKQF